MPKKTVTEVRDALAELLKRIKIANGFKMNLPDDHIYKAYSSELVNNTTDSAFPKCFVMIEGASTENQPGQSQEKKLAFTVLIVAKKTEATNNVPSQQQIEGFIEDMEKLMFENDDLAGTVHDAQLTEWVTDGGVLKTEAVAAFKIETIRFSR